MWPHLRSLAKPLAKPWSIRRTTELHLIAALSHDLAEPLTVTQKEALQRAVTKIVALGAHVGVNRDQMILLLESGLAVGELLEYLAARSGEGARNAQTWF
jgi:hypothetical protein